ncbi:MAG: NYN domain-containing protein [Pacificimonas sp.]
MNAPFQDYRRSTSLAPGYAWIVDVENVGAPCRIAELISCEGEPKELVLVADYAAMPFTAFETAYPLARHIHAPPTATGKNRTDFAICGETIALLNQERARRVVILSNDSDFDTFIAAAGYNDRVFRIGWSKQKRKSNTARPIPEALYV